MNSALVFVCSDRVGAYVNVLSFLSDKRNVSDFSFIFVTGAMIEGPKTNFINEIVTAIEDLAQGVYGGRPLGVDERTKSQYATLASDLKRSRKLVDIVSLEGLRGYLRGKIKEVSVEKLLIDVTGLPKTLTADVLLICLERGCPVYTFELRNKGDRSRPGLSLYPSLTPGSFDYSQLTRDPAVQSSIRQLIHIKHVMWIVAVFFMIGCACFAALLVFDPGNATFAVVGLAANVIGIASGVLQVVSTRNGR